MKPITCLRAMLVFIAVFHVAAGCGLMFSTRFQQCAAALYGAQFDWNVRDTYFIRILGSFAFVLGYLAAMASRDPVKHRIVVIAFIEFFVLRNINRHLYAHELYDGFAVTPMVNDMTSVFFGAQALVLAVLMWLTARKETRASDSGPRSRGCANHVGR